MNIGLLLMYIVVGGLTAGSILCLFIALFKND